MSSSNLGWKLRGCGANVCTFWGCHRCQCDQIALERINCKVKSAGIEKVFPNLYKWFSMKYFINCSTIRKGCTWRNHKNCHFFNCPESCCGNVRIKEISQHQTDPECFLKLLNWALQLLQESPPSRWVLPLVPQGSHIYDKSCRAPRAASAIFTFLRRHSCSRGLRGVPQESGSELTAKGSGRKETRDCCPPCTEGNHGELKRKEKGLVASSGGSWRWIKSSQSSALVISTVPSTKEKRLTSLLPTIPFNVSRALPKYKWKWK